jgi:DNA-binding IclR family transcriptional regulator
LLVVDAQDSSAAGACCGEPARSLQDIASELGLTREALYRTFAGLERAGAIERAGDRILLKKSLGA